MINSAVAFILIISSCQCSDPLNFHDLVVVESAGDAVVRLRGYDLDGDVLKYAITSVPTSGVLYQLSKVFSSYGYDPKEGENIKATPTLVTGSKNRIYYRRPTPDSSTMNKWGTFTYTVSDGKKTSYDATVTFVPPSGALVGSNFLLSGEGWTIVGNKALSSPVKHEPYSRGASLSQYVIASDDKINVGNQGGEDQSLFYFQAPPAFLGNQGIAYGGQLQFTLAAFSGDFSSLNKKANLVELDCRTCVGPVGPGITLVFPLRSYPSAFKGDTTVFALELSENAGWLKDPQNVLLPWTTPSKCDMIQVLSRLSSLRILGDWTTWYETVALDNVQLSNTKERPIPVCAMVRPDASICTC